MSRAINLRLHFVENKSEGVTLNKLISDSNKNLKNPYTYTIHILCICRYIIINNLTLPRFSQLDFNTFLSNHDTIFGKSRRNVNWKTSLIE